MNKQEKTMDYSKRITPMLGAISRRVDGSIFCTLNIVKRKTYIYRCCLRANNFLDMSTNQKTYLKLLQTFQDIGTSGHVLLLFSAQAMIQEYLILSGENMQVTM
jgi:hypothetical protein